MRAEKYIFHDDERARCVIEFWRGKAFIHLAIRQWGMDTRRELLNRWPEMKRILKVIGFDVIYAYVQEERVEKFSCFVKLFGFQEVRRSGGLVLMEVSNA